jgi:hypothetical protein
LKAFRRRTFPVPVRLNRFAAARFDFIFGILVSWHAGSVRRPAKPSC